MAVASGTPTTSSLSGASTSNSFSFVSTANPLYVRVSGWVALTISGITFNAVALTKMIGSGPGSGGDIAEIWKLASPGAVTANVVITYSASSDKQAVAGAANYTGQGATPDGSTGSAVSTTTGLSTGNVSLTGAAVGDLTIACVGAGVATGPISAITPAATGGGTVTEDWDLSIASNTEEAEAFRVPDAVTAVSASWASPSASWAIAALVLKATAAAVDPFPVGYGRWPQRRPPNMRTLLAR